MNKTKMENKGGCCTSMTKQKMSTSKMSTPKTPTPKTKKK